MQVFTSCDFSGWTVCKEKRLEVKMLGFSCFLHQAGCECSKLQRLYRWARENKDENKMDNDCGYIVNIQNVIW